MGIDIKGGGTVSANAPTESHNRGGSVESNVTAKQKIVKNSAPLKSVDEVRNSENRGDKKPSKETKEELQEWVSKMNVTINEKIKFAYSEDFGGIYVTVVDNETQEVIRKIPTEDAIKLSAIWKEAVGNIFDSKG